jgi:hypothetical protein
MATSEVQQQAGESSEDNSNARAIPSWQRDLLDERLASAGTEEGRDWDEVKAEIWPPAR